MLSQDSFDSVNSPALSIAEEEMEDEDDAMELLGKFLQMFDWFEWAWSDQLQIVLSCLLQNWICCLNYYRLLNSSCPLIVSCFTSAEY